MKKIIKSTEIPGGNLSEAQSKFMRQINMEPEFDQREKSWKFHKVLKTDTKSTPWLISIEGEYFVAVQSPPSARGCNQVAFYPATPRGKYAISLKTLIERLLQYIDLEAACDEFAENHYYKKMVNAELDEEMEILKELQDETKSLDKD